MDKKILIRCDSSLRIGTGHVMRCLSLAQKLHMNGYSIVFACRILNGNIIRTIEERQFKVHLLPLAKDIPPDECSSWREVSFAQEVKDFGNVLKKENPAWVIVDHYDLNIDWELQFQDIVAHMAM